MDDETTLRSAAIVAAAAAQRIFPGKPMIIRHGNGTESTSLCEGLYADVVGVDLRSDDAFQRLHHTFEELLSSKFTFEERCINYSEALEAFKRQGSAFSIQLVTSKHVNEIPCYSFAGFLVLNRGSVAPDVVVLKALVELAPSPSRGGLYVRLRSMAPSHDGSEILHNAYCRAKMWGAVQHEQCVGSLNDIVTSNGPDRYVRAEETKFQFDLLACAKEILSSRPRVKLVLIAGPSAAGKTTFSMRLCVALRTLGMRPSVLSVDDYYRDIRDPNYPKLANGKPNHETVEALRVAHFQEQMTALFQSGGPLETPVFDMVNSRPFPTGRQTSLARDGGVMVVEGLFALDPSLTSSLDQDQVYRIFLLPLPQYNLDELTFVSNQTVRILRRVSRDYLHRGRNASASLARVSAVRAGEELQVMPALRYADFVFNSTLSHELHLLVSFSRPLLQCVAPGDATYNEARRLIRILDEFLPLSAHSLPPDSLLREFVGGSVFDEAEHVPPFFRGEIDAVSPSTDAPLCVIAPSGTEVDVGCRAACEAIVTISRLLVEASAIAVGPQAALEMLGTFNAPNPSNEDFTALTVYRLNSCDGCELVDSILGEFEALCRRASSMTMMPLPSVEGGLSSTIDAELAGSCVMSMVQVLCAGDARCIASAPCDGPLLQGAVNVISSRTRLLKLPTTPELLVLTVSCGSEPQPWASVPDTIRENVDKLIGPTSRWKHDLWNSLAVNTVGQINTTWTDERAAANLTRVEDSVTAERWMEVTSLVLLKKLSVVWVTGPELGGKSSLSEELQIQLAANGVKSAKTVVDFADSNVDHPTRLTDEVNRIVVGTKNYADEEWMFFTDQEQRSAAVGMFTASRTEHVVLVVECNVFAAPTASQRVIGGLEMCVAAAKSNPLGLLLYVTALPILRLNALTLISHEGHLRELRWLHRAASRIANDDQLRDSFQEWKAVSSTKAVSGLAKVSSTLLSHADVVVNGQSVFEISEMKRSVTALVARWLSTMPLEAKCDVLAMHRARSLIESIRFVV